MVGVNRVGTDGNQLDYVGDSAVISPNGEVLAEASERQAVLLVDIDPGLQRPRESGSVSWPTDATSPDRPPEELLKRRLQIGATKAQRFLPPEATDQALQAERIPASSGELWPDGDSVTWHEIGTA